MISFKQILDEGGLWDNIHAKRNRIKNGSGERMREPGSKGAPTDDDFKSASESVVPDRMKGKQKPYVSSDGKGGHEVLGNTGQVKATFSQKEHGKEAKSKAIAHLQKHYDTYMKEDLKADFKALRAVGLDEANFADTMKKAVAAHERGDHKKAAYHLDNAKTARYAMNSTEISKHKDLLDKYKELRSMHE